mmetsp:Transcript_7107/g.11347  ORF Transcript_7107/g.11347 Transcript_7107/m.11347 type:complete len:247 (-) Transcript_7107:17-757(-)
MQSEDDAPPDKTNIEVAVQSDPASSSSSAPAPALAKSREEFIDTFFSVLDHKHEKRISRIELFLLAQIFGFPGDAVEYDKEYQAACADAGCDPQAGIDEKAFARLMNNENCDYFCDEGSLESVLVQLRTKVDEAVARSKDGRLEPSVVVPDSPMCSPRTRYRALTEAERQAELILYESLRSSGAGECFQPQQSWCAAFCERLKAFFCPCLLRQSSATPPERTDGIELGVVTAGNIPGDRTRIAGSV